MIVEAFDLSFFIPPGPIYNGACEHGSTLGQEKLVCKMISYKIFVKIYEWDSKCGLKITCKVFNTFIPLGKSLRPVMVVSCCQPFDRGKDVDNELAKNSKGGLNLRFGHVWKLFDKSLQLASLAKGVVVEDLQKFSILFRSLSRDSLFFKVKEENIVVLVVTHIHQIIGILVGEFRLLFEGRLLKMESDLKTLGT